MALLLILMLFSLIPFTIAQENTDYRCTVRDQQVFPRFEPATQRLVLVSWNTSEEVQVMATGVAGEAMHVYQWTSDCQFLLLGLVRGSEQEIMLFSIPENRLVGSVLKNGTFRATYVISPDEQYVLMETREGVVLWHLPSNRQSIVAEGFQQYGRGRIVWDTARNQVLGVFSDMDNGVKAIDLASVQVVAFYSAHSSVSVDFRLQGNEILVASNNNRDIRRPEGPGTGVAIWNRDTGWNIQLDLWQRHDAYMPYIFSPDGRYLVIESGNDYIWDLWNLVGEAPHPPNTYIRRYKYWTMTNLRFTSNTILEGYKTQAGPLELFRWDVTTQAELYFDDIPFNRYEAYCADPDWVAAYPDQSLIQWACGEINQWE